ncbi:ABC transporter ATP-binding protein [Piscibacillus salipiscarius]|uniref:ABC transporter ATP-binding protein n=1 Tax=Piscibacillus salipiscarius TaxID=299480 RepID=UPI000AC96A19
MNQLSTEKRLFQYALFFKKSIIIGLVCLMISVALELSGPFIAKHLIDQHIVGVANHYVVNETESGIKFEGNVYERIDRTQSESDEQVTLFQDGLSFYLFNEKVPLNASLDHTGSNEFTLSFEDETYVTTGRELSTPEVYTFFKGEISSIMWLLALYIGLILIASYFLYFKTYLLQFASNRIIQKMRRDVFEHIQSLPIKYFVDQPAGKIVARVTNDTEAIRELYVKVLEVFASGAIYILGIFVALFILDPKLAGICLVLLPIMFIWMKAYKTVGGRYNKVIRETNSQINANINESIQGMSVIQSYQQTDRMMNEFEELNEKQRLFQTKMNTFTAWTSFNLVDVFRNVALVVLSYTLEEPLLTVRHWYQRDYYML